jgi:hypothetical protein
MAWKNTIRVDGRCCTAALFWGAEWSGRRTGHGVITREPQRAGAHHGDRCLSGIGTEDGQVMIAVSVRASAAGGACPNVAVSDAGANVGGMHVALSQHCNIGNAPGAQQPELVSTFKSPASHSPGGSPPACAAGSARPRRQHMVRHRRHRGRTRAARGVPSHHALVPRRGRHQARREQAKVHATHKLSVVRAGGHQRPRGWLGGGHVPQGDAHVTAATEGRVS